MKNWLTYVTGRWSIFNDQLKFTPTGTITIDPAIPED